ncbi:MAG: DUF4132 domain-containing protein [Myxococcales bacterium]|nr:DUF4132 domain-containing protein [Myxococcales bacterium]
MSTTDTATIADIEAQVWRRSRRGRDVLAGLRRAAACDEAWAWALAQSVEILHPVHVMREEAQAMSARWAEARGLAPHLWADRVAAAWPADEAHAGRFWRVQRARLEWALREQTAWPLDHLEALIRDREAIASALRGLLWIDAGDVIRWFDDQGRARDLDGEAAPAGSILRIAHPAHPALRALERGRLDGRVEPSAAPFPQLDRERFGPESLERDADGWLRPRWNAPVPLFRLHELRRGGWRFTDAEDNGTVAGIFLVDRRADQTALWRLMNRENRPHYGYPLYIDFDPPDLPIRVGLALLRGEWDRSRLGWSFGWPPKHAIFNPLQPDMLAPEDADPIFLSEALRDVWRASRPGASAPEP